MINYHRGDCLLAPTPGRKAIGTCNTCDPEGEYPLRIGTHRQCDRLPTACENIEADIADDITPDTRTMDEIRLTLDGCFSGCRHLDRWCRRRGAIQLRETYQAWIEYLLEHDCDPE